MIHEEEWTALGASSTRLTGHELIVLGQEASMCVVESGSVAIFCAEVRGGALAGPRRFLCRIGSGQALFSLPDPEGPPLSLLVVPVREAVLREVPLEDPRRAPGGNRLLDEWIQQLARLVTGFGEPGLTTRASGSGEVEVEEGQVLSAERDRVVWIQVTQGALRFMGSHDRVLRPGPYAFPLDSSLWVRASEDARVSTFDTDGLDGALLRESLARYQRAVLEQLQARFNREEQGEKFRLRERARLQEQHTQDALDSLASALDSPVDRPSRGSGLMMAMQILGRELGQDIKQRDTWESGSRRTDPVEAIARSARLRLRRVTLRGNWWKWDCGPLLGFSFEDGQPVALVHRPGGYEIVNPADDTRTRVDKKTAPWLAPEATMVYRPLPEGRLALRDLIRFSLVTRKREFAIVLWTGLAATLLGMVTPQAVAILLDHAIPDADRRLLFEIGAGLLAAAIGAAIFQVAQGIVLLRISLGSEGESQAALWDRVLRLRPSFFRGYSSGDLQSRVMAVNEIGREFSSTTLSTLFSSLLAVLNLALLFYYSSTLSLLALAVGLLVMAVTTTISVLIRKNLRELMEVEGKFFGMIIQLINAVGKLRVAGAAERAYTHWLHRYSEKLKLLVGVYRLREKVSVFNQVLPILTSAVLFLVAFGMLQEGRAGGSGLSLGTFMAFNVAFSTFLGGITGLSGAIVSFMDIAVKGKRIKPILDEETEVDLTKADPGELSGRIELEGIEFSYRADGAKTLDGVHLRAEPGEFVAIVGPSGSGKSTIFRMLLGFETPHAGTVAYDGQELANLDVLAVRRQLGVVLQGGRLDVGSIFENIASGNLISLDEAWAAAEDAGCAEEIREMPMGMHTVVSVGGSNLSGGQRQRILIARALAHRPRILLFDEATSALDNRTQAVVSESLERLNVTRIVVAHRLSTIRNADRIYVLDRGKIVQSGRFRDLMADDDGLFARMMKRQIA